MSQSIPDQGRPWPMYAAIAGALALIGAGLYFAGSQGGGDSQSTGEGEQNVVNRQRQCEEELKGILAAVDPTRLGVSSRPGDRAGDLNVWLTDCGAGGVEEPITQDRPLVESLLSEEAARKVAAGEYSSQDVRHLRTSLLARQIAEHVAGEIEDPLEQAVTLFHFVTRTVLDPVGFEPPPMSPYESLLIGRGTAAHRAWVFAELLRQLRVDAVLLEPAAEGPEGSVHFVGVPIRRGEKTEVYVFDVLIGLPVPAASEAEAQTPFVQQPATLAEIRENDALLRRLDAPERPYPFQAEQFRQVRAGLIGESSMWSERMARLDFETDWRGATFYDGLGKNRMHDKSLHERIVAAGADAGWDASQVFVWTFPELSLSAFEQEQGSANNVLRQFQEILAGPYPRQEFEQYQIQNPEIRWNVSLQNARNLHISGAFQEALTEYRQIREAQQYFALSPLNDWCRESAAFWTAGCQYELGAHESVRNSAATYPPPFQTPAQPLWADGILKLAAYSSAQLEDYRSAAALLQQPQAVRSHGGEYLIRRWMRLGGFAPEEQPEAKPETPDPADKGAEEPAAEPAAEPSPDGAAAPTGNGAPTENGASPAEEPPEDAAAGESSGSVD